MDRQMVQALLDSTYEARRTEDIEAIIEAFHPEGAFEIDGSRAVSASAIAARGHQDIRSTMAELIKNFRFLERSIISCLIDGDRAAVHSRVKLEFVPAQKTVTTDLLDLWKFENGKVVELIEFVDTALVNDLTVN